MCACRPSTTIPKKKMELIFQQFKYTVGPLNKSYNLIMTLMTNDIPTYKQQ